MPVNLFTALSRMACTTMVAISSNYLTPIDGKVIMYSTSHTKVIHADIQQIWDRIHDFYHLHWAKNVIETVDVITDISGNLPGAKRLVNGAFTETLLSMDAENHQFQYSVDDGPSPVSREDIQNYIATVKLSANSDNETEVFWGATWEANNEDAVIFCHTIYEALLNELALSFA